ncbi:MAG TPA: hypothetical protein VFG47_09060, partial [Geminicoccaceae bacterium]|nr:hypothetical protein [Geminicoccaceae bacterium]
MADITGTLGDDTLEGTAQNDRVLGLAGRDLIAGLGGDDLLFGNADPDHLLGGDGADVVVGGGDRDWLEGGAGDDRLGGGPGADWLYGDGGGDTLRGADGADLLLGGGGNDVLYGQAGDDQLGGDEGADLLFGGDGGDVLRGGLDDDRLSGGAGDDALAGEDGDDALAGDAGADALCGGAGDDLLRGGEGDDLLLGGAGRDVLGGGAGADWLNGGPGADVLRGGAGDDVFAVGNIGHGLDVIVDFVRGEDRLDLSAALPGFEVNDPVRPFVQVVLGPQGTTVAIDPTGGGGPFVPVALLRGVQASSLSEAELGLPTPPPPEGLTLVSAAADGTPANADSGGPAISADGRYVAFASGADNLGPADANGTGDVYRKDLATGDVVRVSITADGVEGNGTSGGPAISADGRFVAFVSRADNLVPDDGNGVQDVFRGDLVTGELVRVSTANDGGGANGHSATYGAHAISADGRYVAFTSQADNLAPSDDNGVRDVFVKDLDTGAVVRASTAADGRGANAESYDAAISPDGRRVAFTTRANNLTPEDTEFRHDVVVKDLEEGGVTLVSRLAGLSDYGYDAALSEDGRYVAFSYGSNPTQTFGFSNVYRHDLQTGEILRLSVLLDLPEPAVRVLFSRHPSISADGELAAFR